jgi:hypothetical protein
MPAKYVAHEASFACDARILAGDLPELTTLVADVAGFRPDQSANHPASTRADCRTSPRARQIAWRDKRAYPRPDPGS